MSKSIIAILLTFLIIISTLFSIIKIGSLGPDDNFFNANIRHVLTRSSILRNVLGLHFDGDARSEYLGSSYDSITIEVDSSSTFTPNENALEDFAAKISEITGKKTTVVFSDLSLFLPEVIDTEHIGRTTRLYKNHDSDKSSTKLYILYATTAEDSDKRLGVTFHEDSIIIFGDTLNRVTEGSSESSRELVEYSTLLHEFGHQLGLAHNEETKCLMNAKAGIEGAFPFSISRLVTDFCKSEIEAIEEMVF